MVLTDHGWFDHVELKTFINRLVIVSTAASRSSTISAPSASVLLGVLPRVRLRCSLVRAAYLVSYLLTSLRFYYETVNNNEVQTVFNTVVPGPAR